MGQWVFSLNFSDKPLLANERLVFSRPKCLCVYKVSICKKRDIITPFNTEQNGIFKLIPKISENQNLQDSSRSSFLVFVSVVHHLFPPRIPRIHFCTHSAIFLGEIHIFGSFGSSKNPHFFLVNSTEIPRGFRWVKTMLCFQFWIKSHEIPRFFWGFHPPFSQKSPDFFWVKSSELHQVTTLWILLVPHQVSAPGLALAQPGPAWLGLFEWLGHGKSMGKAWEDGDFTRKNGDLMGCRADFLLEYHCNNYGMWKLELL